MLHFLLAASVSGPARSSARCSAIRRADRAANTAATSVRPETPACGSFVLPGGVSSAVRARRGGGHFTLPGGAAGGASALAGSSWAAGGALLAASVGTQLLGAPQLGPALEGMVRASTPIAEASASGRPTVFEFYRPDCPRCRALAQSGLRAVEEEARAKGVNWVMLDTNSPAVYRAYVRKYGVADLPHFTFFAADGHVMGAESGLTADVDGLAARVAGLARSSALFPSG